MTDFVSFEIRDGDTLIVTGQQGAFRGRGLAEEYTLHNSLRHFASELVRFPNVNADLDLRGSGFVKIAVKQIDAMGHIEFQAKLSELIHKSSADLRFEVDYEILARFAKDVEKLIRGDADKATIAGNV